MIVSLMAVAVLMGAGDPDGVIVTAPNGIGAPPVAAAEPVQPTPPRQSAAHGLTTDQQIEQWIAARREADESLPYEGVEPEDDRQVHGEFSVGVGTGGYRAYGGAVSLPIGRSGRLELQYRDVENDPYARYYSPYGYDGRYGWGADAVDAWGHYPAPPQGASAVQRELVDPR